MSDQKPPEVPKVAGPVTSPNAQKSTEPGKPSPKGAPGVVAKPLSQQDRDKAAGKVQSDKPVYNVRSRAEHMKRYEEKKAAAAAAKAAK